MKKWMVAGVAMLSIMPAHAQEAPAPLDTIPVTEQSPAKEEPPKAEAKEPVKLEEVVVTSTKRPMALRDIPQSITSLSGDDLERRGVQNLQDVVKLVPGVNMVNDAIAPRVTIRGISSSINTSPT